MTPHTRSSGPPDRTRRRKCLFSKGFLKVHPLERPFANGPPDDLPRIRKKAVWLCVRGAMQSILFKERGLLG
jgi:hypothetical protein